MLSRRSLAFIAAGLVVGALIGPPGIAAADKLVQDVFITNTSANPVPVDGTVSVDNLPASQEVTGTVNVGNLPATQTVTGTVNVANAVDHAPSQPFDASVIISAEFGGTPASSQLLLTVPEGRPP